MKFFISSVRRGLEEERDALPGLISALGHEAIRFEDFTAQDVPSREACLGGVDAADAYLLLLGDAYGDPLPDTGLSPTEEEFNAARRRGIPILAFRKAGVTPDQHQEEFIRRAEDYATGKFRGSFSNTAELLTAVTAAVREVELTPPALAWEPLHSSVDVDWTGPDQGAGLGYGHTAILELHVLPDRDAESLAVAELDGVAHRLARIGRDAGYFGAGEALDVRSDGQSAWATTTERAPERGIRVSRRGPVSVWLPLERDNIGSIVDPSDVEAKLDRMLQLADEVGVRSTSATFAVGLGPVDWTVEGRLAGLGHRNSVSVGMRGGHARVDPEDAVPSGAIRSGSGEIARELTARLMHAFRAAKG